jgi:hypothetical protein
MQNNMTKEEAADLKALTDRLVECELALAKAQFVRNDAARNLENFVHRLQFPGPKVRVRVRRKSNRFGEQLFKETSVLVPTRISFTFKPKWRKIRLGVLWQTYSRPSKCFTNAFATQKSGRSR